MSNTDPKPGGFIAKMKLLAAEMNLIRAGVLAALDTGGGVRAMSAKLTLQGADKFELDAGQLLYANAGTITRGFGVADSLRDPADWTATVSDIAAGRLRTITVGGAVSMRLDLPHGNAFDSVTIYHEGAQGNAADPANKPTLSIWRRNIITGVATQIGTTTTATYVNIATYISRRALVCTGLAHTVDRVTNEYFALYVAESGANSLVNGRLYNGFTSCTITKQPVGY